MKNKESIFVVAMRKFPHAKSFRLQIRSSDYYYFFIDELLIEGTAEEIESELNSIITLYPNENSNIRN